MTLDGSFVVAAPRERVWRSLRDPEIVGSCVPGCAGVEVLSPAAYRANIAVTLGPISAKFILDVEITEETYPERISLHTRGAEGSRASVVNAVSVMTLDETATARTEVRYKTEVSITGRLGKFGLGVFKKKADQIAKEFTAKFAHAIQTVEAA
jgi:carbon monoxide dehydrogenase subunit G